MNYDEQSAREALRELDPFMLHIRSNGASESDVPALAAAGITSALLAMVSEIRALREQLAWQSSEGLRPGTVDFEDGRPVGRE